MLDEIIEQTPDFAGLGARLAAVDRERPDGASAAEWLRSWNDREGFWANVRNIEHWINRARDCQ